MKKAILHHYVEITDSANSGILRPVNKFEVDTLEVLGENDRYMVVNNLLFTTIDKKGSSHSVGEPLGTERIRVHSNDNVWGSRITYSLYSEKRKTAAAIRKAIEKEIQKRFGFFTSGIDLSIVSDAKGGAA